MGCLHILEKEKHYSAKMVSVTILQPSWSTGNLRNELRKLAGPGLELGLQDPGQRYRCSPANSWHLFANTVVPVVTRIQGHEHTTSTVQTEAEP